MRKGRSMKKRNIIIWVFGAIIFGTVSFTEVRAQGGVFMVDDEEEVLNTRVGSAYLEPGSFGIPLMPEHDSAYDYTPIGDGIWLLGCLGGAYLLGKCRRKGRDDAQ